MAIQRVKEKLVHPACDGWLAGHYLRFCKQGTNLEHYCSKAKHTGGTVTAMCVLVLPIYPRYCAHDKSAVDGQLVQIINIDHKMNWEWKYYYSSCRTQDNKKTLFCVL
jgi:hypothetical protein